MKMSDSVNLFVPVPAEMMKLAPVLRIAKVRFAAIAVKSNADDAAGDTAPDCDADSAVVEVTCTSRSSTVSPDVGVTVLIPSLTFTSSKKSLP